MSDGFRFGAVSTRAIRDPKVSHALLHVLAEIATFADSNGWCEVRQTVVGDHLGISRQAVSKHVQALVELGHLMVETVIGADGSQRANRYCVRLDPPATSEVAPPATLDIAAPDTPEVAPRTDLENRPREQTASGKPPRPPNPLFDALVSAFGPASTSSRAAFYGRTIRELKAAGATAGEIIERARRMPRDWRGAGPAALTKHWDELGPAGPHRTNAPEPGEPGYDYGSWATDPNA